jgi:formylglycine-generating enzyme required for sulfatase activity
VRAGEVVDGEFELKACLGHGGFGEVWLASQRRLTRDVVLKFAFPNVLNKPGMVERFQEEARTLGKLDHPNIVHLVDAGQHDGRLFLVMQFAAGGSLLARAGQAPLPQVVQWMDQVCDALAYAHTQDVVHRDIKPENLLLTRFGQVQVADFGVAKTLVSVAGPGYRGGTVAGTPGYWAPEQEDGEEVDRRADLYALGATIYQLVTGEAPGGIRRKKREVMLAKVVDERLRDIVAKLTEEDRDQRFGTAEEVKAALAEVVRAPAVALPVVRSAPPASGSPWWGAASAVVGAGGAAAMLAEPAAAAIVMAGAAAGAAVGEVVRRRVGGGAAPLPPRVEVALPGGEVWAARVVPAGRFRMGGSFDDERPHRWVTLTAGFVIGESPVTQAHWRTVVEAARAAPWAGTEPGVSALHPSPSFFSEGADAPQRPVEHVSWLDTMVWCNALSRLTGRRPAYRRAGEAWTWDRAADGFRLPTEAEWEYACRAGSSTAWSFGDNEAKLADYAWYDANSANTTHPVLRKQPNPLGLHDMNGNVWEYCFDKFNKSYNILDTTDPVETKNGAMRITRGGCFQSQNYLTQSGSRMMAHEPFKDSCHGLRVVLSSLGGGP